MRIDIKNAIAFDEALPTAVATADHGDTINAVKAGNSHPELYLVGQVREVVTSGGAATVNIKVVMADDDAFSENLETIVETGALALTALTAGTVLFKMRLPLGLRQYIKATATVAVAELTGGKVDIVLVDGVDFHGMEN